VFAEVPYVPALVFPFVKLFECNELAAFETIMCVLLHWGCGWLDTLPHAPIPVLCMAEELLERHDQQLHQHFAKVGLSAQVYAWCLIRTLLTEALPRQDWLVLWDHLFAHAEDPSLLVFAALAFLKVFRASLLTVQTVSDFEEFMRKQVGSVELMRFTVTNFRACLCPELGGHAQASSTDVRAAEAISGSRSSNQCALQLAAGQGYYLSIVSSVCQGSG
jgi:hypothetical protein